MKRHPSSLIQQGVVTRLLLLLPVLALLWLLAIWAMS